MVSHHLLSKEQFEYLTSQKAKSSNPSQHRKRISEKVDKIFSTMKIILNSKNIDQELKDEMFIPSQISLFINSLTQYDPENTNAQESNKQQIIIDLMHKVMAYYQSRYKETRFISKRMNEINELAQDLEDLAREDQREDEATIMYKTRRLSTPPLLTQEKYDWTALCMFCFSYSSMGKKKDDSIKHIRHAKNCSFHKEWKRFSKNDKERVLEQFFKTIPPKNKT